MIRHLLLIKFKDSASSEQIDELKTLFELIPSKVDGVISVEWGLNDSPERKNKGYTRRFSLYVLANTFIPPNNHDFASLRRCSFTRNHAK